MAVRQYLLLSLWIVASAGCSSTSCCNWWGRNTDGSSNLARNKPTPVQQGPLAGTYTRPGNETTTIIQSSGPTNQAPPVVSLTQANQAASGAPSSPLMAPPTPPQGVVPTQYEPSSSRGVLPPSQLPPASVAELPENKPSIPTPDMPITMPQVQAPALDLTVPGATSSGGTTPASPTPLLLAPPNTPPTAGASMNIAPPNIEMPVINAPTIPKQFEIAPPKVIATGKPAMLNPGTVPPPLPPPPSIPVLDKK